MLQQVITKHLEIDVTKNTRRQEYVTARMIYYKILRDLNYSWTAIGLSLKKNHATILHAVKVFNDLITYDSDLKRDYEIIKEIYFQGHHNEHDPLYYITRDELISLIKTLENQNKNLTLDNELLNNRLKNYKIYDPIVNLCKSRNKKWDGKQVDYIKTKLNHILNGI